MSDIIKILPDSVANQIAAGEVIQRPASVIKELVENAVDAGATTISIIVKDAGRTLIQIIDNGCGMSETDARLSFERHATSKIRDANDLFNIRTMGFRGEALASIASIAQVNLKTKRKEDELGTEIDINACQVEKQEVCACADGTNFSIKNIFFNVPARRKFLKSDATEFNHIITEFQRIALANCNIEFILHHNNNEIYNLPRASQKQRIVTLYGKHLNQNLVNIELDTTLIKIRGFVGKPEAAKKTSGEQYFFVNNRYMKHAYFHKAIVSAYDQLIQSDAIPSYFIYFDVDPKTIDINIHPTKTEIKFENERALWQIINVSVKKTLGKSNFMPSIDFNTEGLIEIPILNKNTTDIKIPQINLNPEFNPFKNETNSFVKTSNKDQHNVRNWEKLYPSTAFSEDQQEPVNTLGIQKELIYTEKQKSVYQFKNKYILTPVRSGLMIIDQQRAHERILYERFIKTIHSHTGITQQNLFPQKIELNTADYLLILQIKDDLAILGFDIADFGSNSIVINGIPSDSKNQNPLNMLESLLEEFKTSEKDIKSDQKEKIARSMAKASSIKAGTALKTEEMQELFDLLFACEMPNYSPSGKVIVSILSLEELEKRF